MSRIGKRPIDLPSGVEVTLDEGSITVKGPRAFYNDRFQLVSACLRKTAS